MADEATTLKLVARCSGVAGYRTYEVVRLNHSAARHWYFGNTSEPVTTPNGAAALFGNGESGRLSLYGIFSPYSVLTLKKSHEVEVGRCSNLPDASLYVNNYRC